MRLVQWDAHEGNVERERMQRCNVPAAFDAFQTFQGTHLRLRKTHK